MTDDEAAALIANVAPDDFPKLEEKVRDAWRAGGERGWLAVSRHPAMVRVRSFHPSGYVREDAVKRLARIHDGSELPYLLMRVNDWVPQVRVVARIALLARIRDELIAELARNFGLMLRIARSSRTDHAEWFGPVSRLLATEHARSAMLAVSRAGSRDVVRFLLDLPDVDRRDVVEAALASRDDIIRVLGVRAAVRIGERALFERLTNDPSPAVRREILLELGSDARHALLDRSASVRDTARFLSKGIDFAAVYRDAIVATNPPRRLSAAIAGLSEVGRASDAKTALPFLDHDSASVRRAAVKCVIRLGGDAMGDTVFALLDDPSPAVSAAARDGLRRFAASTLDASRLTNLLASPFEHARRNAVHLIAVLPKWPRLIGLLRAARTQSIAHDYVRQWNRDYNRSMATPSRREIEDVRAALLAVGAAIDPRTLAEIQFVLP